MQEQIASLRDAPDIIIATPGQLVKHLSAGGFALLAGFMFLDLPPTPNSPPSRVWLTDFVRPSVCVSFLQPPSRPCVFVKLGDAGH